MALAASRNTVVDDLGGGVRGRIVMFRLFNRIQNVVQIILIFGILINKPF